MRLLADSLSSFPGYSGGSLSFSVGKSGIFRELMMKSLRIVCILCVVGYSVLAQDDGAGSSSCLPLGEWRMITSYYGWRDDPFARGGEFHRGIDLQAHIGDPVYAWRRGVVVTAGYQGVSGKVVVLQHPDHFVSKYHHLSRILVHTGQQVTAGQMIGKAGDTGQVTGVHLHFTIMKDGEYVDPLPYLKESRNVHDPAFQKASPENISRSLKTVTILSIPRGVTVYLDGAYSGKTPLKLRLLPGFHQLKLVPRDAFLPLERTVEVKEQVTFSFRLKKRVLASNPSSRVSSSAYSPSRRRPGPEAAVFSIIPGMGQRYLGNDWWMVPPLAMGLSFALSMGSRSIKERYHMEYRYSSDPVARDSLLQKYRHFRGLENFFKTAVWVIWGADIASAFLQGVANVTKNRSRARQEKGVFVALKPLPTGSGIRMQIRW